MNININGAPFCAEENATVYDAAQAAGLIGEVVKVWCTASDERVCKICGPNDGVKLPMNADFSGAKSSWSTKLHPPLHPACRCALIIEEISPPAE